MRSCALVKISEYISSGLMFQKVYGMVVRAFVLLYACSFVYQTLLICRFVATDCDVLNVYRVGGDALRSRSFDFY